MKKQKAVLLFSGGQDSTTCLYWAKERFDVYAIGFNYGQKHVKELAYAEATATAEGVPFLVSNVENLLTPKEIAGTSPSFLAGRNILFLSIAASFAATIGANDIITGVCQTDFSGFPDCRRNTVEAMQLTLSLGLGIGDIRIHTPLMYLTKAETWRLGKELGCYERILRGTLTDYNGSEKVNEWGYGVADNAASTLRAEGFYEAKGKGWI